MFAKLGGERKVPRPSRLRPAPPPSRSVASVLVNVALLGGALIMSGWVWIRAQEMRPTRVPREATDGPSALVAEPDYGSEPDGSALPLPEAQSLVLPGLTPPPTTSDVEAAEPLLPALPPLNESSATPARLSWALELARQYPDSTALRDYIARAHLFLSSREVRSRRYRDALRYVDGAEKWGAPSAEIATYRAIVYGHEERWELAEQWARTALAYRTDAAAEMYHLIGKAHYFREELNRAVEAFRQALSYGENSRFQASLDAALRDARSASGFDRQRLSHFIVSYEGDTMEGTGRMVLDTMERSYASLVSQLGFEPSEPVVVVLYSRRSYTEMGGPHWSAGYFDGKIRVPVRGLSRVDQQIQSTLHHELAHAFVHAQAGRSAPRWLHEGIAEYVEGTDSRRSGPMLAKVLNDGKSFEACLISVQCDVRLFYPAASSMVDYMIQMRGMGGVKDVLSELGRGDDIDAALRTVLGKDQSTLVREWEHFVKRRYS